jgi:hypothetical protein
MILESRPEGDYKVKMIGQTKSGKIVERNYCSCCALDSCKMDEGTRYSIIYEFNSSAISMYENI